MSQITQSDVMIITISVNHKIFADRIQIYNWVVFLSDDSGRNSTTIQGVLMKMYTAIFIIWKLSVALDSRILIQDYDRKWSFAIPITLIHTHT